MPNRRVGGIIFFQLDGELFQAKGEFTYNLGVPKRDEVVGPDGVHGFSELPQAPRIEGAVTDNDETDLEALLRFRDGTATLQLANGKTVVFREAFYSGDGDVTTNEGEIGIMIRAISAQEVAA